MGQPDPGAGLKGGWGWGWKAIFFRTLPPTLPAFGSFGFPWGQSGAAVQTLCRAAFSIGFPLPSSTNL